MTFVYSELFALASIVTIGIFMLAGISATQKLWGPTLFLAPIFGVIVVATLAWIIAIAFFVAPPLGIAATWLAFLGALVSLRWFDWKSWGKTAFWATVSVAAYASALIGFGFLWGSHDNALSTMQNRFFSLPIDNGIPSLFADRLWHASSGTFLVGDWHASDRPPLQAGFILVERALLQPFVSTPTPQALSAMAVGIGLIAQLLWIPAMFGALRALRFSHRATIFGLIATAVTPVIFMNSLYSWPKLLSAALMVAAIAICVDMLLNRQVSASKFAVAGVSVALSLLAHGAGGFALPVFIGIALAVILRKGAEGPLRARLLALGTGALSAIITYVPWIAYQRFVDPPGDRLIKWHLAGMIPPTENQTFLDVVVGQYSRLKPADWAAERLQNIDAVTGFSNIFHGVLSKSMNVDSLKNLDFFSLIPALVIPVALGAILVLRFLVHRRRTWPTLRHESSKVRLGLLGLICLSIGLWIIAMFLPYSTLIHQGSHLWPLVLVGVIFAAGFECMPRTSFLFLTIQATYAAFLYTNSAIASPGGVQPLAAALVVGSGILALQALNRLENRFRT
jgi:hypothetical protein